MKTNQNNDDPLRTTLREWKQTSQLPPRFQEAVWKRIETTDPAWKISLPVFIAQWFASAFSRPAQAGGYIAILLVAGMATGYFQARQAQSHFDKTLSAQYVQAVDPYQKIASSR